MWNMISPCAVFFVLGRGKGGGGGGAGKENTNLQHQLIVALLFRVHTSSQLSQAQWQLYICNIR